MITDDQMRERLKAAKPYTLVILHKTAKLGELGSDKIVWEHGRRNFQLRDQGVLAIVCPVGDESAVAGIYIFTASPEETKRIMEEDPGVRAGIFTYEVHPTRGFPGSTLP